LLHNLYPDALRSAAYSRQTLKTKLTTQPFTFLAMLADGLQKWDRVCLLNEATSQISGFIPGSRYNLEIRDDQMLHIRLLGPRLMMAEAEDSLRKSLGAYLEDADSLIRLKLEEA
jgi:hypothetical protein